MEKKTRISLDCSINTAKILSPRCIDLAQKLSKRWRIGASSNNIFGFCAAIRLRHSTIRPWRDAQEQIYQLTPKPQPTQLHLTMGICLTFAPDFRQFTETALTKHRIETNIIERSIIGSHRQKPLVSLPSRITTLLNQSSEHRIWEESRIRSQELISLVSRTPFVRTNVVKRPEWIPETSIVYFQPNTVKSDTSTISSAGSTSYGGKSELGLVSRQGFDSNIPKIPIPLVSSELERLADQVVTALDRRTLAYRERMGRI